VKELIKTKIHTIVLYTNELFLEDIGEVKIEVVTEKI
jgi:hypothetical protein